MKKSKKIIFEDFKTYDGEKIVLHKFIPEKDTTLKGAIQIVHGSTEHALRYKKLAEFLNTQGYAVYALDLRGHGLSVKSTEDLGCVDWRNCSTQVLHDIDDVFTLMKKEHPARGIKFYLIGHSYGSFLAQRYTELYNTGFLSGAVFSGPAGPQTLKMFFGRILIALIMFFTGKNTRSQLVRSLVFGSYNKKFDKNNPKGYDWLSRDKAVVAEYTANPLDGFDPPNCFAYSLVDLIYHTFKKKGLKKVSSSLPMLYIWGTDDPVGEFGKLPLKLTDFLIKNGKICKTLVYQDGRHEMFNELNKEQVYNDLIFWINS